MDESRSLLVTHIRNPVLPQTWTGTPANLIRALTELELSPIPVHSGIKKPLTKIGHVLGGVIRGLGPVYFRQAAARLYGSQVIEQIAQSTGVGKVLHTTTLDFGTPSKSSNINHFLYTDSTWDMWYSDKRFRIMLPKRAILLADQLDREAYCQCEHIFTTSKFVADRIADRYGVDRGRITPVGTGYGPIRPTPLAEKDYENGRLLFVARHRFEDKGGSLLVDAFRLARKRSEHLSLVILGNEKIEKALKNEPGVSVLGRLPWEEVQRNFDEASLFVMPAQREPWGMVYLEAMVSGTPIMGLDYNAFPELAGHGSRGIVVSSADPDELADEIVRAVSDSQLLRTLGSAAQKYVTENFSWIKVAQRMASEIFKPSFFADSP